MLKKLTILPGILKTITDYAAPGRYVDAQWVRFVSGNPEKMGGWAAAIAATLTGVCRAILCWRDNSEVARVAFGTHSKLYVLTAGTLVDVTPLRERTSILAANTFATTIGINIVTVNLVAHNQQAGDQVSIGYSPIPIGGLLIGGNYTIFSVFDANHYTIIASTAALSTVSGADADVRQFLHYRLLLGADPIATVSGSPAVTITDADSLVAAGDTVIFSGATAVGGITLDGPHLVLSADAAGYTVVGTGNANATAVGGGASVTVQNEIGVGLVDASVGVDLPSIGGLSRLPRTWSLAPYGEWLLANPRGGPIYVWDPKIGGRAIALFQNVLQLLFSVRCLAMFVTSERYIVALGKDKDDALIDTMQLGWCDQSDPTVWVQSLSNTANESRHIQGGNFIMCGGEVRNQASLIFTDTSVFLHEWRTDNYVFKTTKLGQGCGILGPNAFTVAGEIGYWVGDGQFWIWDGALKVLPADDVREWFFENLNREQRAKVVLGTLASQNELVVLYPEVGHTEINRYLLYNIADRIWSTGAISRTAWEDRGLFPYPLATDATGQVWNHEFGVDGGGAAIDAYIVAAPADFMEFGSDVVGGGSMYSGDLAMDIFGFLPDMQNQVGALSLYVLTRERAMDTPISEGPFTLDVAGDTVDLRSSGQMAGYRIESNVLGGDFRIGVCRVEAHKAGARRS